MGEKTGGVKQPPQKRPKKWGEEGFQCDVQFGCYTYKVYFVSQDEFENYLDMSSLGRCYGAVCYDDQIILIASNISEQLKRLTVWHELMHVMLQNNNVNDGRSEVKISDEGFTDTMASRVYEVTRRNPELMRWLMK